MLEEEDTGQEVSSLGFGLGSLPLVTGPLDSPWSVAAGLHVHGQRRISIAEAT